MKKDFSEDTSALTALAEKSIGELYGVQDGYSVSPIKYSENIIYKVTFADGEKRVFRLHRPAYHTESELESELIWLDEIRRDTDLTVPALCRGRNGNLLQTVVSPLSGEKYFCDLMSFIEGKTVGDLPPEQLPEKVREIGVITAKLHRQAENRDRSVKLDRMAWDVPSFFGENAVWGSWRNYSGLKPEDFRFFQWAE